MKANNDQKDEHLKKKRMTFKRVEGRKYRLLQSIKTCSLSCESTCPIKAASVDLIAFTVVSSDFRSSGIQC